MADVTLLLTLASKKSSDRDIILRDMGYFLQSTYIIFCVIWQWVSWLVLVYHLHEKPGVCAQVYVCFSYPWLKQADPADGKWVWQKCILFSNSGWRGCRSTSLVRSLSAFSELVIGMSSYEDPVHSATCSFVQVANVKQQISTNKSISALGMLREGAGLRHIILRR